jgi:hypothetical protein
MPRHAPVLVFVSVLAPLATGCLQQARSMAGGAAPPPGGAGAIAPPAGGAGGNGGGGGGAGAGGSGGGQPISSPPPAADAAVRPPGDAAPAVECEQVSAKARAILQMDCAYCHQSPAKMGNFDFILDTYTLTLANSTAGNKFVVPGAPERSRIYQRIAANEMPPAGQMPRPSKDDLAVIRAWIMGCVMLGQPTPGGKDGGADLGAPPDGPPDPGPGCGGPLQECCDGNVCENGGCCVLGECRANGMACNDGPGQGGLAGVCTSGSCINAGMSCGGMGQACCAGGTCTANRVYCGLATPKTCVTCGGMGQPCCGTGGGGSCAAGLDCQGDRFPLAGSCKPCGTLGLPCCGNGPTVLQSCNAGLTCQFDVQKSDAICIR